MFSYLLDTEFLHTKAIIIIGVGFYLAITVVIKLCGMWTSTDCLYFDMSACCLKCKSNGQSLWIMATTECYNAWSTITTMDYGIVEFSVRDKQ